MFSNGASNFEYDVAWDMDEFWVFGYGSLMWNPGFAFEERRPARAFGFRRSLCVWSYVHRGTPEHPGLVLGLDRGGSCRGVAFRVSEENREDVLDYLRRRELVTNVYKEKILPVSLGDGRQVRAVGYIVDRRHVQYAGALGIEDAAEIVRTSSGQSGPNDAYVFNTLSHLKEMGIRDLWLEGVGVSVSARLQAAV
ncbi:gamma-glutamylcyclotransferase [Neorhizobium sp. CSC1952]|uniref:gamma-glutamylcyclotransferase n=1 Tax=Neorhizobium sp. CSC1952 TaxID=2978974 RepID=UPI0025A67D1D|nr:gamma-glutamylcyclotransferase [Rhizobium sp. CSC1952]WJR69489.1 gamma-glutamylcyclotransferase [Rhizobium sp. CSC1952]